MKEFLLKFSLIILSIPAFAQNQPVLKDFVKKIENVTHSFSLNDRIDIIQLYVDADNFELAAIDNKMQVLWQSTYKGCAIKSGRLKDKILAVSSLEKNHTYSYEALLIDPRTGKLEKQQQIYRSSSGYSEAPEVFFSADGSYCRLIIRQTSSKKFGDGAYSIKKVNETTGLTIIDIKNDATFNISKPDLPESGFTAFANNSAGNLFVIVPQDDKTIKAYKFEAGQNQPSASIIQSMDMVDKYDAENDSYKAAGSDADPNTVYFGIIHKNPAKDVELTVCKLDFAKSTGKISNQLFTKSAMRSMVDKFMASGKTIAKPELGGNLSIKYMKEWDYGLIVTVSGSYSYQNNGVYNKLVQSGQNSVVIDGYDQEMNLNFQQIMPNESIYNYRHVLVEDYHLMNGNLYMIANAGNTALITYYGQLDLKTGNWTKLQTLDKGKLNSWYGARNQTLWYPDCFILVYHSYTEKIDVDLQLNVY